MTKRNIGVIGNGNVGGSLARGLKRPGHDVQAVDNNPTKIRETAMWADIVLLAVPFEAIDDVRSGGCRSFDECRLLEPAAYLNIQLGYAPGLGTEVGITLARA